MKTHVRTKRMGLNPAMSNWPCDFGRLNNYAESTVVDRKTKRIHLTPRSYLADRRKLRSCNSETALWAFKRREGLQLLAESQGASWEKQSMMGSKGHQQSEDINE